MEEGVICICKFMKSLIMDIISFQHPKQLSSSLFTKVNLLPFFTGRVFYVVKLETNVHGTMI